MNQWQFKWNLTQDVELREGKNWSYAFFTLACNFNKKVWESWEQDVDFLPFIVYGKKAEALSKFLGKWDPLLVSRAKLKNYKTNKKDEDWNPIYKTDIICQEWEFCSTWKWNWTSSTSTSTSTSKEEDEMPF